MTMRTRSRHRALAAGVMLTLCLSAPAFAAPAGAPSHAQRGESGHILKTDRDASNSRLIAAAEPFEALTEQAFTAKGARLDQLISAVQQAADRIRPTLSQQDQAGLQRTLARIHQARQADKPHEMALAAVEGYRTLVSATRNTRVPQAVSLLDYAGFRYQADLTSQPTRWQDMNHAVQFAHRQWQGLAGQVHESRLKNRVGSALSEMETAVQTRSAAQARTSVRTALDLVDELERYFSRQA